MFSIVDYGAQPNEPTSQQGALQSAIDACASAGGGTVVVPAGTYVTGTVALRSHVTLHLENGARLVGSTDLKDYPEVAGGFTDAVGQRRNRCLLYAKDCVSVGLSGPGTIDGRGGLFPFEQNGRPFMIRFVDCQDVQVSGVTLRDSPGWVSHFLGCERVLIHGVTIHSHVNANNDGIDIDSCRRVRITACDIDTGDDAICIKATRTTPCEHITVTGCILRSTWGALKLGTESAGDFRNIIISDIVIRDTQGGGLKIISMDGCRLENIQVNNVLMDNVSGPIFIRLGARLRTYHAGEAARPVGTLRNVAIRNVSGRVYEEGYPLYGKLPRKAGIVITGIPGACIEDLLLEGVKFTFPGGGSDPGTAPPDVPEQEAAYPEFPCFHPLPAWGIFARHVRGLTLRHVTLATEQPDLRAPLVFVDVEGLTTDHVTAPGRVADDEFHPIAAAGPALAAADDPAA